MKGYRQSMMLREGNALFPKISSLVEYLVPNDIHALKNNTKWTQLAVYFCLFFTQL